MRPVLLASAALLLAAFAAASCTFPTVDYVDGGAASTTTMPVTGCTAPMACADQAQKCSGDAHKNNDGCLHQCDKEAPSCTELCAAVLSAKLTQCSSTCQMCAQGQGCADAVTSCKGIVGN